MPRYVVPLTHRPNRDGSLSTDPHVPFYLALEAASDAWKQALAEFCAPDLVPFDLAVVHLDSDFRRELFTGELTVHLTVEKIGTRSVTFGMALEQSGADAGSVRLVYARVGSGRESSLPLNEAQRAALQRIPA